MPGDQAMYARVAARLREEVKRGTWEAGQVLPGEIELARRYGVARVTMGRALQLLRNEGVIVTLKGIGSQVAAVPVDATVLLGPGDWAVARMPEEHERAALGMSPGVPVLVVTRAGGAAPELHDAAVTRLTGA